MSPKPTNIDLVLVDSSTENDLVSTVHNSADASAAAVVILSTDLPASAVREAAKERNIALASVVSEHSAAQLARRWNTRLVRASDTRAEDTLDLHEQLVRSLLADGGISGALRVAMRALPEFEAVVFTYFGEVAGHRHPSAQLIANVDGLYGTAKRLLNDRDWAEEEQGDGSAIVAGTVCIGRDPEAFLVFRGPSALTTEGNHIFRQCQIAVLLALGRQQSFRRARRSAVDPLLRGAEGGTLGLSEVRSQLQYIGFLAVEGYRALCLTVPADLSAGELCSLVESVLETSGTPVVGAIDDHVYCLIEESGSDQAQRLLDACNGRRWTGIQIGVSRVKADALNLRVAMREALVAAGHGSQGAKAAESGIQRVENLGIQSMLAPLLSSDGTRSFVVGLLGPLRDRDANEDSRLLETLTVYFDEGCHPGSTASLLNIHRHSLANRLDRIKELIGHDPRDPAHLLTFSLAVKLWKEMGESNVEHDLGRT